MDGMSLDLSLVCEHCGNAAETFNSTYNVSPMWYHIYPEDEKMVDIDGMTGKEAAPKLSKAVREMINQREYMLTLEPENEWGNYKRFLAFLQEILYVSEEQPNSVWEAWR